MPLRKTSKKITATSFDPSKAVIYFDLNFAEENLEEDKKENPERYQEFMELGGGDLTKAAFKVEAMALKEAKAILKVSSISNEGHDDNALTCRIGVKSLKEAKAIFERAWKKVGGGDDIVYLDAPYMEMRGFQLFPEGINGPVYTTKGSGDSDVEEYFETATESKSANGSTMQMKWTKDLKSRVEAALKKAGRRDLAAVVAATQEETVEYLKKAGILPPDAKSGEFPPLGKEKVLEGLSPTPAAARVIRATVDQAGTVAYLKQAGVLPPGASIGEYPQIGANPTWDRLKAHPAAVTASVPAKTKKEIIAVLLKARRPDLANSVSSLSETTAAGQEFYAWMHKAVAMTKGMVKTMIKESRQDEIAETLVAIIKASLPQSMQLNVMKEMRPLLIQTKKDTSQPAV